MKHLANPKRDTLIQTLTRYPEYVSSGNFSSDESKVITTSDDRTAKIGDIESSELLQTLNEPHSVV